MSAMSVLHTQTMDGLFDTLTKKGFTVTKEGTFEAFLGIKFERDPEKGL
jgi:hypothetical protein